MSLQISIREVGNVRILDLRGRSTLDDGESELLSERLRKLIESGARKILLNLADVTKIDSSGISVIVGTCVSLRKRGGDLRLLRPRGRVLEVLTVFRLLEVIPSFEREAEALASFEGRSNFATS